MSGKFSSIYSVKFAKFQRGKGSSHSPRVHFTAHRGKVLPYCLRTADILKHYPLFSPFFEEIMSENGNHQVRRDESAVFIHEHNSVSITIIDDSDIGFGLSDKFLQCLHICRHQRVRFMIWERAIHLLIYI